MKKIISLISALTISAAAFSAMTVTSFAAPSADSKPEIQGYVETVDADGYAIMKFELVNNETLSYSLNRGKVTSNGLNNIEAKLILDETVFNVAESYISGGFTGVNISGDCENWKVFSFAPTSVDSYMTSVPEYLFQVDALLKDGYTIENIPHDAVRFEYAIVEYTSYDNVATSAGATTYTIYGYEVPTKDYDLTVKFTGTAAEEDDDDEPTVTPVAMDAGVEIAEGPHAGKTSVSAPEAVAVADFAKIEITNDVDTSKTLEWTAPTTLGDGKTNVLAVLVFDKAAMAGSTFTVKYLNAASEAIKIFTHAVAQ